LFLEKGRNIRERLDNWQRNGEGTAKKQTGAAQSESRKPTILKKQR
jgi:hypothetical protein